MSDGIIEHLRQAKHLSVVEIIDLDWSKPSWESPNLLKKRKAWEAGLIDVLKNSSSKDRKFLRWSLTQLKLRHVDHCWVREVMGTEVLEVLPESSP